MNGIQRLLFPGILFGAFVLIVFTRLIANPTSVVFASGSDETMPPQEQSSPQPEPEAESDIQSEVGCPLGSQFPDNIRQWCGLIQNAASQHGLDPNLIAAVMLQESGGNSEAYSRSGAVGLMQIMPRDGIAASFQCANGPCFSKRPSIQELYDPQFNVEYGARMLSGLISSRGSVRDALKSYGPMDMGYRYADLVLSIYENYR